MAREKVVTIAIPGKPNPPFKTRTPAVYGLTALIEAERTIAEAIGASARSAAVAKPSPPKTAAMIEAVISNAAKLLGRPEFVLDADQADALRNIFEHRASIITGPPGSGKTAIIACR